MGKVYVFEHPLIQHKTGMIRNVETTVKDFRELVKEIAMLMCYEATRDLPLVDMEIQTPICRTTVKHLEGEDIAIVPILRAGLGMVEGMLAMVPNAKVGHIGLYRDPDTHEPVEYYCKLPSDIDKRQVFVVSLHVPLAWLCVSLPPEESGNFVFLGTRIIVRQVSQDILSSTYVLIILEACIPAIPVFFDFPIRALRVPLV